MVRSSDVGKRSEFQLFGIKMGKKTFSILFAGGVYNSVDDISR